VSQNVNVMTLTDRAKRALVNLHAEYKKKVEQYQFARHTIYRPGYLHQLSEEYNRKVAEICNQGLTETTADRTVRVQCPSCGRIEQIAGDVERWTCVCGPFERYAYLTYV
jgi:hypothetical protein